MVFLGAESGTTAKTTNTLNGKESVAEQNRLASVQVYLQTEASLFCSILRPANSEWKSCEAARKRAGYALSRRAVLWLFFY